MFPRVISMLIDNSAGYFKVQPDDSFCAQCEREGCTKAIPWWHSSCWEHFYFYSDNGLPYIVSYHKWFILSAKPIISALFKTQLNRSPVGNSDDGDTIQSPSYVLSYSTEKVGTKLKLSKRCIEVFMMRKLESPLDTTNYNLLLVFVNLNALISTVELSVTTRNQSQYLPFPHTRLELRDFLALLRHIRIGQRSSHINKGKCNLFLP